MTRIQHSRDGFALAVAIAAIVVIGALIAGVFFASQQQYRIGGNTLLRARAVTAAEYGLNAIFDTTQTTNRWNTNWNNETTGGLKRTTVFASNGAVDTVRITKVNRSNFIVVSEARVRDPRGAEAHARLGMLIPLRIPQINMRGAFTSRGNLKIGGASTTDGNDHTLPNWNCPPLDTAIAGVSVSDTNSIQWAGQNHAATGNPPVLQDTVAAHDSTYQKFGDIEWEELVAMAQKVITSGSSGAPSPTLNADGTCKTSDLYNWGDPERAIPDTPCANYYPIIYATGNLQLSNGVGQGMLLVEGDLKVTAFRFYGPVIVKGSLDATGPGSTFTGGVLAGNASGSTSSLGNSSFKYSSCALMRAMAGSATPLPNRTRSWLELF